MRCAVAVAVDAGVKFAALKLSVPEGVSIFRRDEYHVFLSVCDGRCQGSVGAQLS